MRLADYIRNNKEQIAQEWESFARTLNPASGYNQPLGVRSHIDAVLAFITTNIIEPQTQLEQFQKSQGYEHADRIKNMAADNHADWRLISGFTMDQMVLEYRALRASITKLWCQQIETPTATDLIDLTRFNEAIDQLLSESITYYSAKISRARQMFLGILGHDLRTPLGAIQTSAHMVQRMGLDNNTQKNFIAIITESASRATEMAENLMDLTQVGLGTGLTIDGKYMDITSIAGNLVQELRTSHPDREIMLDVIGDTTGFWDKMRVGQIFSNLIGNALQYGARDKPIRVRVNGSNKQSVELSVHNAGKPMPSAGIESLFDSYTRGGTDDTTRTTKNLGLGLYITKEIVAAHKGTIDVRSSEAEGTLFTIWLPRIMPHQI